MLTIDGSTGEGGGQILRSSLSLSAVTGTPVEIVKIRAKRKKGGLGNQHLTSVRAAAEVCGATVTGDELGSKSITFEPGTPQPGRYTFDIGSAGSTTLVFQTLLPILMRLEEPSELLLKGGTHNGMSPPLDFLTTAFLPLLSKMGPRVHVQTRSLGFYPKGGGEFEAHIQPASDLRGLSLSDPVSVRPYRAVAIVANLPTHIAEREVELLGRRLGVPSDRQIIQEDDTSPGPGNICWVELDAGPVKELISAVGKQGVSAEQVASSVAREAKAFRRCDVPVGPHLADQLLLPLALGAGGSFDTVTPTEHTKTNIHVIEKFLPDVQVTTHDLGGGKARIEVVSS